MRRIALLPLLLLGLAACNGQGDGEIDPDRPERNCSDEVDNDQDGLTDCDDDDCDDLCEGGGADEICDNGTDDDGDGAADCDDSDCSDECIETCDDGADNDADGLVDCDDDECADVAPCWWPETINHSGDFDFDADHWAVDDCRDAYTTVLTETTVKPCAACSRTFEGTFSWTSTQCNDEFGDGPPPSTGRFGFAFPNPDKWVLFAEDNGAWKEAATLDRTDAGFVLKSVDPVDYNGTDVGELTTTLTFTEAE